MTTPARPRRGPRRYPRLTRDRDFPDSAPRWWIEFRPTSDPILVGEPVLRRLKDAIDAALGGRPASEATP